MQLILGNKKQPVKLLQWLNQCNSKQFKPVDLSKKFLFTMKVDKQQQQDNELTVDYFVYN